MIYNLFPNFHVRHKGVSFYGPRMSDEGADTDLISGTIVQRVSGTQLHLVINTPPEVELSSTSTFLFPE